MILIPLCAFIGFGLAIRPAHAYDNEQPISTTGKARK